MKIFDTELPEILISIDAGRSALKVVDQDWRTYRIPSVHGIVTKDFLKNAILKKPELITSMAHYKDGEMWIIGRAAIDRMKSDQLIEVNETKEFLKNSTIYTLASLTEVAKANYKIKLLTQLTSNDKKTYGKGLKKALDGTKEITRFDSFGDEVAKFTYEIETDVYLQGLCAYFDLLFDKNGNIDRDLEVDTVLVVDIGHQSTDIVLVKGLSVSAVGSYPVGSGTIFYSISDMLRKEGVTMAAKDIEWRFIEGRHEVKSREKSFDIRELMKEQAEKSAQRLVNFTLQEFASETIDRVILTGGSSSLFFGRFKESWPFCVQPEDPQFSNAKGALKWKLYGETLNERE